MFEKNQLHLWLGLGLAVLVMGCSGASGGGAAQPVSVEDDAQKPVSEKKSAFYGSERCEKCHPNQVEQWRHSLHGLAHFEPVYDFYFIEASKDSNQELETFCADCHTPIGVHGGEIPFAKAPQGAGDTKVSPVAHQGLSCDFCHTITGYTKLENSGYEFAPSTTKQGPLEVTKAGFHKSAKNPLFKSSDICGTCHNVNHPTNGIVLEATYTEWKNSPYAAQGVTCQDCHMTTGLTKAEVHPGKAATRGPEREHVSKHYFVGPNIMFADEKGAESLKELSLKLLKSSGKIEVGETKREGTDLAVSILVTNTGAGHYLPTGITEIREAWVALQIMDAEGKMLFESGALDSKGVQQEGTVMYRTDVLDESGTVTTQFWNTVKKLKDYRIPPKETLTENYKITLPKSVSWPLTVKASLQYRSASPAGLADVNAPADIVEIPVLTISSNEKQITK